MPGAIFNMPDAFAAFGVRVADGAMNATGSNPFLLNSATAAFTIHDVGKKIKVEGAGAGGVDLTTKIVRRISATQVELKDKALTTVVGSDISYVKGVYRMSTLLAGPDIDGNSYSVLNTRRLQVQVAHTTPGGSVFIGGPYVTTTNYGVGPLASGDSDQFQPGTISVAVPTGDYLTSDQANQKVAIYWQDDFNQSTPAP